MDRARAAELLGVGPDPTGCELQRAFRAELRRRHPDAGGEGDVAELLTARRVLATGSPVARRVGPGPDRRRAARVRRRLRRIVRSVRRAGSARGASSGRTPRRVR